MIAEPFDACSPLMTAENLRGSVALAERGHCSFLTKAINVESAGSMALIVIDNDPNNEYFVEMIGDNTDRISHIPSVFLNWLDGNLIKNSIESKKLSGAKINIPLNVTLTSKAKLKKTPWAYW